MSNARIGFVGVGLMGHGIAKNLVAKGYPLTLRVHRNRAAAEDLFSRRCEGSGELRGARAGQPTSSSCA